MQRSDRNLQIFSPKRKVLIQPLHWTAVWQHQIVRWYQISLVFIKDLSLHKCSPPYNKLIKTSRYRILISISVTSDDGGRVSSRQKGDINKSTRTVYFPGMTWFRSLLSVRYIVITADQSLHISYLSGSGTSIFSKNVKRWARWIHGNHACKGGGINGTVFPLGEINLSPKLISFDSLTSILIFWH